MERREFVKFWAKFVRENPDEVWSSQQKVLIDSQIKSARSIGLKKEEYMKIKSSKKYKQNF
jgi:hypothetical protein